MFRNAAQLRLCHWGNLQCPAPAWTPQSALPAIMNHHCQAFAHVLIIPVSCRASLAQDGIFFKPYLMFCYDADALWFAEGTKISTESIRKHCAWVGVCTRDRENSSRVSVYGQAWPFPGGNVLDRQAHLSQGALLTQLPPRCHDSPSCTVSLSKEGQIPP